MRDVEVQIAPGEREIFNIFFKRQSLPLRVALTDRALYTREFDRRSMFGRWIVHRIPLEQITRVKVERTRLRETLLRGLLLAVFGGVLTLFMVLPLYSGSGPARVTLIPIALVLAGILLPFVARGHRTLTVELIGGKPYRWKPPFLMANITKRHVAYLMETIIKGFRSRRIYVSEQ